MFGIFLFLQVLLLFYSILFFALYYDAYYLKALRTKALIKQAFDKAFAKYDVILGPAAPTTAPKLGESLSDPLKMYLGDIYTISVNLAGLPGITVVEPKKSTMFLPNYWLTTIKVDSNETSFSALQLMQHLAKADIETRPLWKPLHLQPVFSSSPTYVNGVSEALFNCGLCLPSGSMMTCEDVMRVADAIRSMR